MPAHATGQVESIVDRMLLDGTADGVVVVGRDHRIAAANERACKLVGGTVNEILGCPIGDFLAPEDLARVVMCLGTLGANDPVEEIVRLDPVGGRKSDVEVRARRMEDGRTLVLLRDMDVLRRQERALRVVSEALAAATAQPFFERLVTALRVALPVDYAFVAEVTAPDADHMIVHALAGPDGVIRGVEHPLEGSLSRSVLDEMKPLQTATPERGSRPHGIFEELGVDECRIVPLADSDGRAIGLIGVMSRGAIADDSGVSTTLDLVASRVASELVRLRSDAALQRSERHLRAMVEASARFVWSVDAENNPTTYAQRTWAAVSGHEIEGDRDKRAWLRAVVAEDRERVAAEWETAFSARAEYELSYRVRAPDGAVRHVQVRGVPVFEDDGAFEGYIGTIEDVTELRRTADELRHKNEVLQVLRAVPEATNRGAGFRECMEVALAENCRAWGFSRGRALVPSETDGGFEPSGVAFPIAEGVDAWTGDDLVPGEGTGEGAEDVWTRVCGSSGAMWLDGGPHVLVPVRLGTRTVAILHFVQPASGSRTNTVAEVLTQVGMQLARACEREQQEQEVRAAQQRAFEAQKLEAIGRLAGGVAHEFNNLLMVVLGEADLALRESGLPPTVQTSLREIRTSGRRAAEVTAQLLSFSRRGMAGAELVDLCVVVDELDRLATRLIGEDVTIETHLDAAGEACLVNVNRGQIEQALLNIVVNAREAMSSGGKIMLRVGVEPVASQHAAEHGVEAGRYLVVSVRDEGEGISGANLESIFEPFFTTKEGGTGLGLASSYGTVSGAGGFMSVESEVGVGTEFKVYLPTHARPEEPHTGAAADASDAEADARATVWIVEDDDAVRSVAARILSVGGYEVDAADGKEELERRLLAGGGTPDVLVTDCILPRAGGREIDAMVRKVAPRVATVFMSGYTDDVLLREGRLEPGQVFLSKPFTPETLFDAIRSARARARANGSAAADAADASEPAYESDEVRI